MRSFLRYPRYRANHSIIPNFIQYGDLLNILSIILAVIELILVGFAFNISVFVTMIILFVSITIIRFLAVLKSNEPDVKHQLATIFNWTIYSAILTALIWGGSSFFLPLTNHSLSTTHVLFLLLIAATFSLFFSPLPIISTLLTVVVLAPFPVLLSLSPTPNINSLALAILLIIIALSTFSFYHGRTARVINELIGRQKIDRPKLLAKDKRIHILEQIITTHKKKQIEMPYSNQTTITLLQSSNEAIATLTKDGHILKANSQFRKITDQKTTMTDSIAFSNLFPTEMTDNLDIALETVVTTGQEISFLITHTGVLRRILFIPSRDHDNTITTITAVIDEVAAQTGYNDTISENKEIWDTILSLTSQTGSRQQTWQSCFSPTLPDLCRTLIADRIFIARKNGQHIDNQRSSIDYPNDILYRWFFSFDPWMSKLKDGETIHSTYSHSSKTEQDILKKENIKTLLLLPVFLEGEFWGVFGMLKSNENVPFTNQQVNTLRFLRNILALHVVNQKNRYELKRLTTVIEQSEDCIMITDPDLVILYTNPACKQVTGYSSAELTGEKVQKLHKNDNRQRIWKEINTTLKHRKKWQGQFINKRKDNTLFEEEMIVSQVHDQQGKIKNLVFIKRNITEAKRLESIAEAANLMDNIGFIFTSLRHELGNPINSLKVSLSIIESNLDNYDKNDIKRFLSRNLSDIKRVEYILTTLRNFSVFEKPKIEPVNMVNMLKKFTNLIQPDIEEKDIKLAFNISDDQMIGLIDPRAFLQVMLNLTTNAIDSLDNIADKRITITIHQIENNQISVSIEDNGCGLDKKEQANLFKPFFTTKPKGTGLGLVIVKKMLAKMNCSIDIKSKKSVGTRALIITPSPRRSLTQNKKHTFSDN